MNRAKTSMMVCGLAAASVLTPGAAGQTLVAANIGADDEFGFGGSVVRGPEVGPIPSVSWAVEFTVDEGVPLASIQAGLHDPTMAGPVVTVSLFSGDQATGPQTLIEVLGTVDGSDLVDLSGTFGVDAPVFESTLMPWLSAGTRYFIVAEAAVADGEADWANVEASGAWISLDGGAFSPSSSSRFAPSFRVFAAVCAGDVDGDGDTDVFDFSVLATAFGSMIDEPDYCEEADLDGNGVIDVFDFGTFVADFGCEF